MATEPDGVSSLCGGGTYNEVYSVHVFMFIMCIALWVEDDIVSSVPSFSMVTVNGNSAVRFMQATTAY